ENPPGGGKHPFFARNDDNFLQPYVLAINNEELVFQVNGLIGGSGPVGSQNAQAPMLPPGTWTYVAGTLDVATGIMNLYINGQLANQATTAVVPYGNLGPGAGLGIGNTGNTITDFSFNGNVDEATLYSNALTGAQIDDIYAAGYLGKAPVGTTPVVHATVVLN